MLEQQVGFAVGIAEHVQKLYFDVVQGVAVGSEHQAVFAAEFAEGQAAADDFQTHAVFFQVDAAQMRIGQAHVFAEFFVGFFAAADAGFLFISWTASHFFRSCRYFCSRT